MASTRSEEDRRAWLFLKLFMDAHGGRMPNSIDELKRWYWSPEGEESLNPYIGVDDDGEFVLNAPTIKEN